MPQTATVNVIFDWCHLLFGVTQCYVNQLLMYITTKYRCQCSMMTKQPNSVASVGNKWVIQ